MSSTKVNQSIEKTNPNFVGLLAHIMPDKKVSQASVNALQASIERGKHLTAQPSNVKEESHV